MKEIIHGSNTVSTICLQYSSLIITIDEGHYESLVDNIRHDASNNTIQQLIDLIPAVHVIGNQRITAIIHLRIDFEVFV